MRTMRITFDYEFGCFDVGDIISRQSQRHSWWGPELWLVTKRDYAADQLICERVWYYERIPWFITRVVLAAASLYAGWQIGTPLVEMYG